MAWLTGVDARQHERVGALAVRFPVIRTHQQHIEGFLLIVRRSQNGIELGFLLSIHSHVAGERTGVPACIRSGTPNKNHQHNGDDEQCALELLMLATLFADANDVIVRGRVSGGLAGMNARWLTAALHGPGRGPVRALTSLRHAVAYFRNRRSTVRPTSLVVRAARLLGGTVSAGRRAIVVITRFHKRLSCSVLACR